MATISITGSTDGLGFYRATSSDGRLLVSHTRQPLLDSARTLLAESTAYSSHPLAMVRSSSPEVIALRATTVAYAAGLEVFGTAFRPCGSRKTGATAISDSDG